MRIVDRRTEDTEDYAAFEMAVTADYDAQSAVERELVLRSLLWRLRRATTIESGLFKIQAEHLLQFRQRRQAHQKRQEIIGSRNALATEEDMLQDDETSNTLNPDPPSTVEPADQAEDLIALLCPPFQSANLSPRPAEPL
jgi:hypothetical protein